MICADSKSGIVLVYMPEKVLTACAALWASDGVGCYAFARGALDVKTYRLIQEKYLCAEFLVPFFFASREVIYNN